MRRREFLAIIGGAMLGGPRWARAQQLAGRVARIGVLMGVANDAQGQARYSAFRQKLGELGWTEGGNARIDLRWGAGGIERIRADATELVGSKPDVIFCFSVRVLKALSERTREVPIVFVATSDPVAQGFVKSFARPGGNLTGFTLYVFSIVGKLVEIMKEAAPGVARLGLLYNPENVSAKGYLRTLASAAPKFGVSAVPLPVRDAPTIEEAVGRFAREPKGALLLPTDVTTIVYRKPIIALAAEFKLPAIYSSRADTLAGGLMSYGPDLRVQFRGAASYVDRILKGEKPGELPIQAPTVFRFVVNLKTAKVLGLAIPPGVLARADEVIQ